MALVVVALVFGACSSDNEAATSPTPTARSACEQKHYVPTYVPRGMRKQPAATPPPGVNESQQAWKGPGRSLSILGNFSGDWGDDNTLKVENVLGYWAQLGHTAPDEDPTALAVSWTEGESTDCRISYAVFSTGLEEEELLHVAGSLRE